MTLKVQIVPNRLHSRCILLNSFRNDVARKTIVINRGWVSERLEHHQPPYKRGDNITNHNQSCPTSFIEQGCRPSWAGGRLGSRS
jgi:hypothetical protein